MSRIAKSYVFVACTIAFLVLPLDQSTALYNYPVNRVSDVLVSDDICYGNHLSRYHTIAESNKKAPQVILLSAAGRGVHFLDAYGSSSREEMILRRPSFPTFWDYEMDTTISVSMTKDTDQNGNIIGFTVKSREAPGKAVIVARNLYGVAEVFVVYVLAGSTNESQGQEITSTLGEPRWPKGEHIDINDDGWEKIGRFHSGIDLGVASQAGYPVYSVRAGVKAWNVGDNPVRKPNPEEALVIKFGSGQNTEFHHYVHISVEYYAWLVGPGHAIPANTFIGVTKKISSPHLHFGIRRSGKYINPISELVDAKKLDVIPPVVRKRKQETPQETVWRTGWKYETKIYPNRVTFLPPLPPWPMEVFREDIDAAYARCEYFDSAYDVRLDESDLDSPIIARNVTTTLYGRPVFDRLHGKVDIVVPVYEKVDSETGIYDISCKIFDLTRGGSMWETANFDRIKFDSIPNNTPNNIFAEYVYPEYIPPTPSGETDETETHPKRYIVTCLPHIDEQGFQYCEDGYLDTNPMPAGVYEIRVEAKDASDEDESSGLTTVEKIMVGAFLKVHLYGEHEYDLNADGEAEVRSIGEISAGGTHNDLPSFPQAKSRTPGQDQNEVIWQVPVEQEIDPLKKIAFDSFVKNAIAIRQGEYAQFTFEEPFRASSIYMLINASNAVSISYIPTSSHEWLSIQGSQLVAIPNTTQSFLIPSTGVDLIYPFWYPVNYTARGKLFGKVIIKYSDGSSNDIELKPGINVRDWHSRGYSVFYVFDTNDETPSPQGNQTVIEAWTKFVERTDFSYYIAVDMMRIDLPDPDKLIKSMRIEVPERMDTEHGLIPIGLSRVPAGIRLMGITILGKFNYTTP